MVKELSIKRQHRDGPGAWPWIVAGSGAAAMIGGGVLLLLAQQDISSVENADRGSSWSDVSAAADRAPILSATGGVLVGVGVAAGLTGIGWAILSSTSQNSDDERTELRVSVHGAGVMAKVTSRF
ncbi:MAG: hypothetical protein IPJ88_14150 [Myxococcales bacterium]|nr:MAG: hypothetical protein IPJ88_14150 [Myxococcales bacterium]